MLARRFGEVALNGMHFSPLTFPKEEFLFRVKKMLSVGKAFF